MSSFSAAKSLLDHHFILKVLAGGGAVVFLPLAWLSARQRLLRDFLEQMRRLAD
jgi:hypothetical protein